MNKYELGISLYPEQETIEDIEAYIRLASKYGFTRIFTSMFSVPGTKEELYAYFKNLCAVAHQYGMTVCSDSNPGLFEKMGATEQDISIFHEIGIDELRMDLAYNDERDGYLVNNPYGMRIMFNASMNLDADILLKYADASKFVVGHNFYPQKYTALPFDSYNATNAYFAERGIRVEAFITSNLKEAHGPWPVWDGLVTVEEMRELPIAAQVRMMIMLGNVQLITISNAFASEEELKAVKETVDFCTEDFDRELGKGGMFRLIAGENRHILDIVPEDGVTDTEKKLVYEVKMHMDLGDGMSYMIRSRMTRFACKEVSIPHRPVEKPYFTRGDVLVVNDNLAHYRGEVQVCLKPMKNDGQRNLIGHVDERELILLDYIKARELVFFQEEK